LRKFNLNIQNSLLIVISISIIFVSKLIYFKIPEYVYIILILPALILINIIFKDYNKYLSILIVFTITETMLSKKIILEYNIITSLAIFYIGINSKYNISIIPNINIKSLISIVTSILIFFFTRDTTSSIFFFSITNILTGEKISLFFLLPLVIIYFLSSGINNLIAFIIAMAIIFIIIQVYESFIKKNLDIEILIFIIALLSAILDSYFIKTPIYFLGLFCNQLLKFNLIENKKYDTSNYSPVVIGIIIALSINNIILDPLLLVVIAIIIIDTIQKSIEIETVLICLSLLNNNIISNIILFTITLIMLEEIFFSNKSWLKRREDK